MNYLMRSGSLWEEGGKMLCSLQRVFFSSEKQVYNTDGSLALQIDIRQQEGEPGDVRSHAYRLRSPGGEELAIANPDYAPGEDPKVTGWPVCRMPRVDHARIRLDRKEYLLTMENSVSYVMADGSGAPVLRIRHRGITGGWTIEEKLQLAPAVLCGLFAFCRYLEGENEFLIV